MVNIKEINGSEIIDYLNSLSYDDLDDISCGQPYVFEYQEIKNGNYRLGFSAYFNNWGTDQLIEDNVLEITEDNIIIFSLNEPFDGDGSDDILQEVLSEWLKTHKFSTTYTDEFNCLVKESNELLNKCQYGEKDILESVIEKLTKAKSLIK